MVALLETFALEKPDSETKNRVGDFFSKSADRAGENSSLTLIVVRKNGLSNYDACRAASLSQKGEAESGNGIILAYATGQTKGEYEIVTASGAVYENSEDFQQLATDLTTIAEAGDSIMKMEITGHGGFEGPSRKGVNMITFGGGFITSTRNKVLLGGSGMSMDITPLLSNTLAPNARVCLWGCNTARGRTNNLASDFSNMFPGRKVSGYSFYAVGLVNFNAHVSAGFDKTYQNGQVLNSGGRRGNR